MNVGGSPRPQPPVPQPPASTAEQVVLQVERERIAQMALSAASLLSRVNDGLTKIGDHGQAAKFDDLMWKVVNEINIGDIPVMYGDDGR